MSIRDLEIGIDFNLNSDPLVRANTLTDNFIRSTQNISRRLNSGFENVGRNMQNFGNSMKSIGTNITKIGASITAPFLGIAATATKVTMDFDKQMSSVKAITGATGLEFDTLRKKAQEMGSSTSKTATESAQAMEYMGLAGWNTTQIMSGIEPVLRLSEAGNMDLARASDLVTDSMSALGLEVNDLNRYLDIASQTSRKSNTSIQQMLDAMVSGGGTFKMFNTPLEEAGTLLGVLANRGIKGAEAGNAITSIMANLTLKSGKSADAMKKLGIEVYDTEGNFRGISTVLTEMNTKFEGMTEAQRNTYIQMIGGKTRTQELNALLSGLGNEANKLSKDLYNADGALSEMALTMQNNLTGAVTKIKSAFEGILIQIGDRLTPYLLKGAEYVQNLANRFLGLSDRAKDLIVKIGLGGLGFGLLITAIGGAVVVAGTLISAIGIISAVLAKISIPILATVAGITLLASGLSAIILKFTDFDTLKTKAFNIFSNIKNSILLIKDGFLGVGDSDALMGTWFETFYKFGATVRSIFETVKSIGSTILTVLSPVIQNISKMFLNLKQNTNFSTLKDSLERLFDTLKILWEQVKPIFISLGIIAGGAIATIIAVIPSFIQNIVNIISIVTNLYNIFYSVFGLIVSIVTGDFDMIKIHVSNIIESLKGILKAFFDNTFGFLLNWASNIIGIFTGDFNKIPKNFDEIFSLAKEKVFDFGKNTIEFIKNIPENIKNSLSNIKNNILNAFDKAKDIKTKLGTWIVAIKDFIIESIPKIKEQLKLWGMAIVEWAKEQNEENKRQFKVWGDALKDWIKKIPEDIKTGLTNWIETIKSKFEEGKMIISNKLTEWWTTIRDWFTGIPAKLVTGFESFKNGIIEGFTNIKNAIRDKLDEWWTTIRDWFKSIGTKQEVKDGGKDLIDNLSKGANDQKPDFMDKLGKIIVDVIKAAVIIAGIAIIAAGREIIKKLIEGISKAITLLRNKIDEVKKIIVNKIKEIDLFQVGKDIMQGLIDGMGSMAKSARETAGNIASGVTNLFKRKLDSHSPSRVFVGIGKDTISGYIIGIQKNSKNIKGPIDSMANDVVSGFYDGIQDTNKKVGINILPEIMLDGVEKSLEIMGKKLSGMFNNNNNLQISTNQSTPNISPTGINNENNSMTIVLNNDVKVGVNGVNSDDAREFGQQLEIKSKAFIEKEIEEFFKSKQMSRPKIIER